MLFECTSPPLPSSPGQCQYDSPPDVVHAQHAESPHRPSLLTKAKMSTAFLPFLTQSSVVWLVYNIQMTPQTKLGWPSSQNAWFMETPARRPTWQRRALWSGSPRGWSWKEEEQRGKEQLMSNQYQPLRRTPQAFGVSAANWAPPYNALWAGHIVNMQVLS